MFYLIFHVLVVVWLVEEYRQTTLTLDSRLIVDAFQICSLVYF